MKPNHQSENDEQLHEALRQWIVDTPLPPRFQEQVWQRIARAETKPQTTITFWAWLLHFVEVNLPRPKVAYSYVAILLLFGCLGWRLGRSETNQPPGRGSGFALRAIH